MAQAPPPHCSFRCTAALKLQHRVLNSEDGAEAVEYHVASTGGIFTAFRLRERLSRNRPSCRHEDRLIGQPLSVWFWRRPAAKHFAEERRLRPTTFRQQSTNTGHSRAEL